MDIIVAKAAPISELKSNIKNKNNVQEFQKILDRIITHGLCVYNYNFVDNYSLQQYIKNIRYDKDKAM